MDIAVLASALKAQEIGLEVGARLTAMAKDVMEDQGASLVKLIESLFEMNTCSTCGLTMFCC